MSAASRTLNQELQTFYNRNMSTKLSRGKTQPPDYLQQFKPETQEAQSLLKHLDDYIIRDEEVALQKLEGYIQNKNSRKAYELM
jgi:hypothetical protein